MTSVITSLPPKVSYKPFTPSKGQNVHSRYAIAIGVSGRSIGSRPVYRSLSDNVLSILPGAAEPGQTLVEHPATAMVAFTGSTNVGRGIAAHCATHFKKTSLELGGNNALIIMEDADIDTASSCAAWGAFLHQGQICMQSGRHLVHEAVALAGRLTWMSLPISNGSAWSKKAFSTRSNSPNIALQID